jgi:hypothetical protein
MPSEPPKRRSEHQGSRAALVTEAVERVGQAWLGGTDDSGQPYPLPDDWTESVRMFTILGLPPQVLAHSVDLAMQSEARDPWRYWCGIAWRRIRERDKRGQ